MNRTFTPSQLFAKTNKVFSQKNHEQQVASSEKVPVQDLDYQNWQYCPSPPLETAILFSFKEIFFDFLSDCYLREYPLAFTFLGNFSTHFFLKVLKNIRCILQGGRNVYASHAKTFVNSNFLIFIPLSFLSH